MERDYFITDTECHSNCSYDWRSTCYKSFREVDALSEPLDNKIVVRGVWSCENSERY